MCASCRDPAAASLIFDEAYYVNAARRIAGVAAAADQPSYARAPSGTDPNAEHPQLAKLVMAAGIEVFGNRPIGYRIGSVLAGTAVLLLMFALVRAAGGGPWLALGATGALAADNLFSVHGRIAMLDIYMLAFMLGGVALYLRRRPVLAGVVLGVGATTKLVGVYALFILGLLELGRWATRRRRERSPEQERTPRSRPSPCASWPRASRMSSCCSSSTCPCRRSTPGPANGSPTRSSTPVTCSTTPCSSASPGGPQGIASYPWAWLAGHGTIPYLTLESTTSAGGQVVSTTTVVAFRGAVNPFLLYLAIPALFAAAAQAWRKGEDLDLLALAWFAGTGCPLPPGDLPGPHDVPLLRARDAACDLPRVRAPAVDARRAASGGPGVGAGARRGLRRALPVSHALSDRRLRLDICYVRMGGSASRPRRPWWGTRLTNTDGA